MNILHIINGYVSSRLYRAFVLQLSKSVDNQNVFVPIRDNKQDGLNSIESPKIKFSYSLIVTSLIYRVLFFLKISKTVKSVQSQFNVSDSDIIHAHTLFSDGAVAYELNKLYGTPYIVTLRNTDLNEFFKYLFYLRPLGIKILMNAERIVFLSKAYQQRLLDNYIHKNLHESLLSKSLIIPNGIDDFWINNVNDINKQIGSTIKLLFTGEIRKNKNIIGVIEAVAKLEAYDIEYLIVGEGLNDEESYLKLIKDTIKDFSKIKMLTAVPKEELLNYYRESDIFIMPSFTETFGLVYAEALSQGIPVIYTKGEGFDKVFEEGYIGHSVEATNIDDIARGITDVIANYSQLQKNCSSASKKFSWEAIAEVYLHNYSELKETTNNAD